MKIKFLAFIAFVISICACSKDDEIKKEDFFEPLSVDTLWFGHVSSTQALELSAGTPVEVTVPEADASWCDAVITGAGKEQGLAVVCLDNGKVGARQTTLILKSGAIEQKLVICQYGLEPVIKIVTAGYELTEDSVIVSVPVISTVDYEVVTEASWIHPLGVIKGENADTVRLGISASIYPNRSAQVFLKWEQLSADITITQNSSDTTYHPGNASALINLLTVASGTSNYDMGSAAKFSNTYDKRSSSYASGWIEPNDVLEMVWNFEQPEQLEKICFVPVSDDEPQRALGKFELLVREEGSNDYKNLGNYDFNYKLTVSSHFFDKDLKKIESVKMLVAAPEGTNGRWVFLCQEMEFWGSTFDVTAVFTDELCTDLKEGVTLEQIMSLEDEFYRNLARSLFLGTYDREFRIQEYQPYIHPDVQKAEHKAFAWNLLDNPTGVYVEAGDEIALFVGETYDVQITAVVIDWNRVTYRTLNPRMTSYELRKGVNVIKPYEGGLMYILYHVNDLGGKQPVKIHIPGGKVNGYFDIARHDNQYWKSLLNKADFKFLDVKGKLSQLLFPTADFRINCPDNIERLVQVYDSIMLLEHQLSGLYKYDRMYSNRMLCRVTYEEGYFMYATNYQTAYHYKTATPSVLQAENLRNDVWGVAHELGHVHQTQDITWRGMTEVSNNVFPLLVQTTFGATSRLLKENRYQEAYDQTVIPKVPYALTVIDGVSKDNPFAKVVPLWQLQLYFAKVLNKPEFYMDLYEEMRRESAPACPQLNFVELCCSVGKIDFTAFFRFYGFFLPLNDYVFDSVNAGYLTITQDAIDESLQRIADMNLTRKAPAIQYLKDDNIDMFKNMKAIEKGQVTLTGSTVSLSGWKNVVAFEVYNGEELIQISQKDSFSLKSTDSNVKIRAVAADGTKVEVEWK